MNTKEFAIKLINKILEDIPEDRLSESLNESVDDDDDSLTPEEEEEIIDLIAKEQERLYGKK